MIQLLSDLFLFVLIIGGLTPLFARCARRYQPLERIGIAVGGALLSIYLFSTLIYLTGADSRWHWLLPCAGLLGTLCSRRELSEWRNDPAIREAGLGWLILAGWCLTFTALITSYAGSSWAGDWHEHYERARFFLEHWRTDYRFIATYPLAARPPLANLVTNALLALGSPGYPRYQVFTCLLCTLTYFPLLNVCRLFGGGVRTAALLAPVLMLNPFFMQNATFAWTKLPAAFFVLTAVPLLIRSLREQDDRWHLPLALCSLAAGILTHYSAAVWVVGLGLGWLLASLGTQSIGPIFTRLFAAGIAATLLLATWFGWSLARYGTGLTFASNITMEVSRQNGPGQTLAAFGHNLLHTLVPHPLFGANPLQEIQTDSLAVVSEYFFHLYQESLSLTLGLAGLLIFGLWLRARPPASAPAGRERHFWWTALLVAGALGIAVVPAPQNWGIPHISLQPMGLLGLAWLAVQLPECWLNSSRPIRLLVVALGLIDFIGGVVIHFALQHDIAARFNGLSYSARTNYAGKIRLDQPFLADILTVPVWVLGLVLLVVFGLAAWRVSASCKNSNPAGTA